MQYKNLGKYTRLRREKLNISLNDFAVNSGIDSSSLSKFERGIAGISFDNAVKIAGGFGKTLGEFIMEYEKDTDNNQ